MTIETDFVEVNTAEIHPACTAYSLLAKKFVDIATRIGLNTIMAEFYEIGTATEGHDLLWANLNTSWWLTFLQAGVITEDTFLNEWVKRAGIAVCWYIEWACNHAVSASNTNFCIIDNGTFFGFCVGINEA